MASSFTASCCTVCPASFHCVRHYGFLANGCRRVRLAKTRELLPGTKPASAETGSTAPPYRHGLPGSTRRFAPVVAATCASPQRCRAGGPARYGADLIHHEHQALGKHRTWHRHRISTGRRNDALCLPRCRTTRRVAASVSSRTCSDAGLPCIIPIRSRRRRRRNIPLL